MVTTVAVRATHAPVLGAAGVVGAAQEAGVALVCVETVVVESASQRDACLCQVWLYMSTIHAIYYLNISVFTHRSFVYSLLYYY